MKRLLTTAFLAAIIATDTYSQTTPRREYPHIPAEICDTIIDIELPATATDAASVTLECRARIPRLRPAQGVSDRAWGFCLPGDITVTFSPCSETLDDITDLPGFKVCVTLRDSIIGNTTINDGIMQRGYNTLVAQYTPGGNIIVEAGNEIPSRLLDINTGPLPPGSPALMALGRVEISALIVETAADPFSTIPGIQDVEVMTEHILTSTDSAEGIWESLDYDTDNSRARLGGRYILATVAREDGGYDIVYLGGAQTNSHLWKPGMIKGRLSPTIFNNHYNLTWTDATGESAGPDTSATIEQNAILRLDFPILKSSLRFSRKARH